MCPAFLCRYLIREFSAMALSRLSSFKGLIKVASRPFATYKTSTGLVGLAVDPNGRETLRKLSDEILEAVKVQDVIIFKWTADIVCSSLPTSYTNC